MAADIGPDPSAAGARLGLVARPPEKRRDGGRNKVVIPATILCPDGVVVACVIRDMSPTGAKLSVSRRHRLPSDFSLAIPGGDTPYPVHCAWQRSDFAGVVLVVPASAAGDVGTT